MNRFDTDITAREMSSNSTATAASMPSSVSGIHTGPVTMTSSMLSVYSVEESTTSMNTSELSSNGTGQDNVWRIPVDALIATMVILTCEFFLSLLANSALMLTIYHSPSLKSPSNKYLVNICATNFLLTLNIFVEAASTISSGHERCADFVSVAGGVQLMVDLIVSLQYFNMFSAIGKYRCKTIRRPLMSPAGRRNFVYQSITISWLASLIVAVPVTLTFHGSETVIGWNAFKKVHLVGEARLVTSLATSQIFSLTTLALAICVNCALIARCYYCLLTTFFRLCPKPKNNVFPEYSFSSAEAVASASASRCPTGSCSTIANSQLFQIQTDAPNDYLAVQYSRKAKTPTNSVALHYPIRSRAFQNDRSYPSSLAGSFVTAFPEEMQTDSRSDPGFTDISAGAELHRAQLMKNLSAMRNQSWRRERLNITSATRNSLVMMAVFVICSFPLFIVSVPGILPASSVSSIHYPVVFSHLNFNIIATIYPMWYLIFSKRVRKCCQNVYDDIFIKLNIK